MRVVVRLLALRPALLGKLLDNFAFRKALGAEARLLALRALGAQIGQGVFIGARVKVRAPENLVVGDATKLEGSVVIDSWEPVRFGRGVIVSDDCVFLTADHEIDSPNFPAYGTGAEWDVRAEPLTIGDYAWLPRHATVLRGAHIGEGAVVGVGSVVTRPVEPWTVVAGNPARKIRDRERHLPE
jgi:acetyltransferase-like isoleucine patch superfamily enzyme